MKVIYSIRIKRDKINELRKLDIVESVDLTTGENIIVRLKPELTDGKLEATKDEYLVQWESGKWQRHGTVAYDLLCLNPSTIYRD